ncbi:hypothetical protein GOV05_00830 [Candidatus Woesearchaeota archaeon]|nr:hypothetical protein [Candidatus Woesearchaeota archaeon]
MRYKNLSQRIHKLKDIGFSEKEIGASIVQAVREIPTNLLYRPSSEKANRNRKKEVMLHLRDHLANLYFDSKEKGYNQVHTPLEISDDEINNFRGLPLEHTVLNIAINSNVSLEELAEKAFKGAKNYHSNLPSKIREEGKLHKVFTEYNSVVRALGIKE